jgi:hypothetical protein
MAVKDREHLVEALDRAREALEEARQTVGDEPAGLTVRDLAERSHISEDAVVAFAETLGELMADRPLTVETARRAALLAAAGEAWENELGPMLSSAQVRELLAGVSRQRVDELLRSHRLIGLRDSAGRRRFPAFQFKDGQPVAALISAFWTVAEGAISEWTAASWCVAPDDALDGQSPANWARDGRDPDRLAQVARQDSARLAR